MNQFSPLRERMLEQISIVPESGCWIWTGTINENGYAMVKEHYKTRTAHRASYEIFVGQIPHGMCVCHKCDVRCCINPAHLFIGSQKDNNDDMVRKGRARYVGHAGLKGERHPLRRLGAVDVINIRSSNERVAVLADQYRVSRENIYAIKQRRTWKHI